MPRRHAVVVGAGIGGLTAAIALHRRGWHITVCERAPEPPTTGAGIGLAPTPCARSPSSRSTSPTSPAAPCPQPWASAAPTASGSSVPTPPTWQRATACPRSPSRARLLPRPWLPPCLPRPSATAPP
ncbi:FAD-dependent oxidoreductase [Streptomyces sp. NPDC056222]|uniref:FAD-dependent oxidoreductase n=1 Tax=Streptomyces sp. NPDC056222 TaxID=3345749 RepID=UPI0035E1EA3B